MTGDRGGWWSVILDRIEGTAPKGSRRFLAPLVLMTLMLGLTLSSADASSRAGGSGPAPPVRAPAPTADPRSDSIMMATADVESRARTGLSAVGSTEDVVSNGVPPTGSPPPPPEAPADTSPTSQVPPAPGRTPPTTVTEPPPPPTEPDIVVDYCIGTPCDWIYMDGHMVRRDQRQTGPLPCEDTSFGAPSVTYRVTSPSELSARTGPGRQFPPAYRIAPDDGVEVLCWTEGAVVEGSSRWVLLADGNWLPDAYLSTPKP